MDNALIDLKDVVYRGMKPVILGFNGDIIRGLTSCGIKTVTQFIKELRDKARNRAKRYYNQVSKKVQKTFNKALEYCKLWEDFDVEWMETLIDRNKVFFYKAHSVEDIISIILKRGEYETKLFEKTSRIR